MSARPDLSQVPIVDLIDEVNRRRLTAEDFYLELHRPDGISDEAWARVVQQADARWLELTDGTR